VVGIAPAEAVASPAVKVSEIKSGSAIAVFAVFVATWKSFRTVIGELLSWRVDMAFGLSICPIWVFKMRGEVSKKGTSGDRGVGGVAMPCPVVCNKPTG